VFAQISGEAIGPRYEEILKAWLDFEKKHDFALGSSALRAQHRPQEVHEWIRDGRGRSMAVRPIADVAKFESAWWKWWSALQPSWRGTWRGRTGAAPALPPGGDWEKLAVHGQNGLLSVVATLYWWGFAEKKKEQGVDARSAAWEEAAGDVLCVLRGLAVDGV
jgi:hypothetical protein